jgi:hypothetical protein
LLSDRIITVRADTIGKLLAVVQAAINHLSGVERDPNAKYCKTGTDTTKCETMMLGSALPKLMVAGLFPVPDTPKFKDSIQTLKGHLYGIEFQHWEGKDYVPHKSHSRCNLLLKESILDILEHMPAPIENLHMTHLNKQCAISGIDNGNLLAAYQPLNPTAGDFKLPTDSASSDTATSLKSDNTDEDERERGVGAAAAEDTVDGFPNDLDDKISTKEEKLDTDA